MVVMAPRFWSAWQAAALLLLLLAAGLTLAAGQLRGVWLAAYGILSTALVAWHWLMVGRHAERIGRTGPMLAYAAGTIALCVILIWLNPIFYIVLFVLYAELYLVLPVRWATGCAVGLTVLLVARGVVREPALTPVWLTIGGLSLLFGGAFTLWIGSVMRQSEQRQRLLDALRAAQDDLAAQQRAAGVLAERARLAGEIHDTLAQGFVSVVTQLEAAEERLAGDRSPGAEALRQHLAVAKRTARDSLGEARRFVAALRPEALDGCLADALVALTARWSAASGVPATAEASGEPRPLPRELEVALLRAAQEALANVARHADAARVRVALEYASTVVELSVRDDGAGFGSGTGPGFGLASMRDRIAAFGGEVRVASAPGTGTEVRVSVP
jgi:signal transduction histidine kinase